MRNLGGGRKQQEAITKAQARKALAELSPFLLDGLRAGVHADQELVLRALLLLCFFAEATLVRCVRVARAHFVVAGRAPVRAVNLRACDRAGHKTFMAAVDWSQSRRACWPRRRCLQKVPAVLACLTLLCQSCVLASVHDHQFQLHWSQESSFQRLPCQPPELAGLCAPCACGSCVLNLSQNSSTSGACGAGS